MHCPIVTIVTLGFLGAQKSRCPLSQLSRLGGSEQWNSLRRTKEGGCGRRVEHCEGSVDFCEKSVDF